MRKPYEKETARHAKCAYMSLEQLVEAEKAAHEAPMNLTWKMEHDIIVYHRKMKEAAVHRQFFAERKVYHNKTRKEFLAKYYYPQDKPKQTWVELYEGDKLVKRVRVETIERAYTLEGETRPVNPKL